MSEFKSFEEFRQDIHHPDAEPDRRYLSENENPKNPKRRKKKKLRRESGNSRKHYVMASVGTIVLIFGILLFAPVPFGNVRLTGNKNVTKEDVFFDGGIREPINILQISGTDLKARLEKDVRIKTADIERSFFELHIHISERKPVAVVQEETGYAYLDTEGVVIKTADSIRASDLPMITGLKLDNLLLGDRVDKSEVKIALDFLRSLSPIGSDMFSEINMGNEENFIAYTRDGVPVRLAKGDRIDERAKLAENIAGDVKARGLRVEFIDTRPSSPFIKMKQ